MRKNTALISIFLFEAFWNMSVRRLKISFSFPRENNTNFICILKIKFNSFSDKYYLLSFLICRDLLLIPFIVSIHEKFTELYF